MKKLDVPNFDSLRKTFRWKTMEGQVLHLRSMETSHIFNSMKMMFNHIAHHYDATPVWFVKKHPLYEEKAKSEASVEAMSKIIAFFLAEIDHRKDLPQKYVAPFTMIKRQLLSSATFMEIAQEPYVKPSMPESPMDRIIRDRNFRLDTFSDWLDNRMDGENGLDIFESEFEFYGEDNDDNYEDRY